MTPYNLPRHFRVVPSDVWNLTGAIFQIEVSDVAVVVVTVAIGTGALVTPVLVGVDVGAEVGHHEHLGLTCSGGAPLSGHVTTWWTERKTRAAIYSLVYNVKACQIHYLYVQLRLGFYTARVSQFLERLASMIIWSYYGSCLYHLKVSTCTESCRVLWSFSVIQMHGCRNRVG